MHCADEKFIHNHNKLPKSKNKDYNDHHFILEVDRIDFKILDTIKLNLAKL